MTKQILKNKTLKELVIIYNKYAKMPIKRFPDKKTGVRRVLAMLELHKIRQGGEKRKKNIARNMFEGLTNAEVAKSTKFKLMCAQFGIESTTRQASKFRNGKGILHNYMETK